LAALAEALAGIPCRSAILDAEQRDVQRVLEAMIEGGTET